MNVKDWIEEWVNLWPQSVHSGGLSIKSKPKECINKMIKFCKEHPNFTKDTIFAATKMYLIDRRAEGFKYTKRAVYFISKLGEPSLLEGYCEKVLSKENNEVIINTSPDANLQEYDYSSDFI